ncbi:hypothetical protein [Photorhabdus africana]
MGNSFKRTQLVSSFYKICCDMRNYFSYNKKMSSDDKKSSLMLS